MLNLSSAHACRMGSVNVFKVLDGVKINIAFCFTQQIG